MNGVGPLVKYPPMSYGQRAECDASSAALAPQGTTSASSTCATTFFLVTVGGVKFHFNLFFVLYVRTYVRVLCRLFCHVRIQMLQTTRAGTGVIDSP